jgi:CBS domain-containing protein
MTLARFAASPLATVTTENTVQDAARAMRDGRVGCLVVTRAGHASGIVTDRDLVVRVLAEGIDPTTALVGDHATYDPVTVSVHDGIETAVERMREHGVRRLPIVNDAGLAVGIVTADDLLALLGGELGALCEAIASPSDSTDSQ